MKKKIAIVFSLFAFVNAAVVAEPTQKEILASHNNSREERLTFMKDGKFGMFIHFGMYSVLGGMWNGKKWPGPGEWILKNSRMPVEEYKNVAKSFNPVEFDAEEIVTLAKKSGMKWIVFTVRHHDAFAMFDTRTTDWDIVDASPYGKDIFKELTDACHKHGIKVGCQFTIGRDWTHPIIGDMKWKRSEAGWKYWAEYFENTVLAQLRELVTNYGEISILWFDSPVGSDKTVADRLVATVHKYQPNCVVNGRGGRHGDYFSTRDSTIVSVVRPDQFWECCSKVNNSWAYVVQEEARYNSKRALIQYFVDIIGKNGMNLLNLGPNPDGSIDPENSIRMEAIGTWIRKNEEAVYGTGHNPYKQAFDFGTITTKPRKMFLHFFVWPEDTFKLNGLKSTVHKAYLLESGSEVDFSQSRDAKSGLNTLVLRLPDKAPDPDVTVLVLELGDSVEVDSRIVPLHGGDIVLEPYLAKITSTHGRPTTKIEPRDRGGLNDWQKASDTIEWNDLAFATSGTHRLDLYTSGVRGNTLAKAAAFVVDVTAPEGKSKTYEINYESNKNSRAVVLGNLSGLKPEEVIIRSTATLSALSDIEIPVPGTYTIKMKLKDDIRQYFPLRQGRIHQK